MTAYKTERKTVMMVNDTPSWTFEGWWHRQLSLRVARQEDKLSARIGGEATLRKSTKDESSSTKCRILSHCSNQRSLELTQYLIITVTASNIVITMTLTGVLEVLGGDATGVPMRTPLLFLAIRLQDHKYACYSVLDEIMRLAAWTTKRHITSWKEL